MLGVCGERPAARLRSLTKLQAYAGRYGSTSYGASLRMTVAELVAFTEALAEILREEEPKAKTDYGG